MPLEGGLDADLRRVLGVGELIGVDEAGRGPLAGPVAAAAVLLGPGPHPLLRGVRDSKELSPAQREALFAPIKRSALGVAVAWAQPGMIDKVNILEAALGAMKRAVLKLPSRALVLVDGNCALRAFDRAQLTVVDGDAKSLAIACASVIAKVARDRLMVRLDKKYPGYGLAKHKGYGTSDHLTALRRLGPSPIHRFSFAPVREAQLA